MVNNTAEVIDDGSILIVLNANESATLYTQSTQH